MSVYVIGSAATGAVFLSRYCCMLSRLIGTALLAVSLMLIASPAWADQTVMAADGSQVDCAASAKDLTRISLVEDEFASVSKISTGNPQDDFSVVNEPVRGDIYLSVPDGFDRPVLSFFALALGFTPEHSNEVALAATLPPAPPPDIGPVPVPLPER